MVIFSGAPTLPTDRRKSLCVGQCTLAVPNIREGSKDKQKPSEHPDAVSYPKWSKLLENHVNLLDSNSVLRQRNSIFECGSEEVVGSAG